MIRVMDSVKTAVNQVENCLDSQLWHACAGGMAQVPPLNSKVFYFPQGHAEHAASGNVSFGDSPRVPSQVLCRLAFIKFMADWETDEVYAKMGLIPLENQNDFGSIDDGDLAFEQNKNGNQEIPTSFVKTLTQSDANNGGGFSVPRYCAETIFPRLDYTADPPVQTILARDVHGKVWKFRHIYRGTPRRHLLTTGWSNFVNYKKLVAGDSIVFLRGYNGDLCVGTRRAKRGKSNGGFCGFVKDDESVIKASNLAANGQPFEVFYYPRASTPEFCVKASTVIAAMRIPWCPGLRFKMAFETEDSSRISWFMGTVSSVHVTDHNRWPTSPWRLLQVSWDEPDLLQNVKRVNPWLVEVVSSMSAIHLSPPRKKLRLPQPPDFPLISSLITVNNVPASIQGARHNDIHYYNHNPEYNNIQSFPVGILNLDSLTSFSSTIMEATQETNEKVSCLLTIGNNCSSKDDVDEKDKKKPVFMLFGHPILTEQQLSESWSGDGSVVLESSSDEDGPWLNEQKTEPALEASCRKVLVETCLYGF